MLLYKWSFKIVDEENVWVSLKQKKNNKKKTIFSSTALFYLTDLSFIVTYSTLFKFVNKLMSNH